MFSYSYAVVQQQEENHRSTETVLRRFATRGDMLAGDTGGQQSEHGLLFRNKHRYDRLDRRTFQTDRIRYSMRERARMACSNKQVIDFLAFVFHFLHWRSWIVNFSNLKYSRVF